MHFNVTHCVSMQFSRRHHNFIIHLFCIRTAERTLNEMLLSSPTLHLLVIIGFAMLTGVAAAGMVEPDVAQLDLTPKSCTMERAFRMLGYVCSNLNLKEVPQFLKSGVEVSFHLYIKYNIY